MPLYSSFRFYFFKILNFFKDRYSNFKHRLKIIYDRNRISITRFIKIKSDDEYIATRVKKNEDVNGRDYLEKKIATNEKNEGDIILKNKVLFEKKGLDIKKIIKTKENGRITKLDNKDNVVKLNTESDSNKCNGDYLEKKIITNHNKGNIILKKKVLFDEKGIDIQRIIRNKNNGKVIINAPTKKTCYLCGLELESPDLARLGFTKCCDNLYHIHCCNEHNIRQCEICKKNLKI